MPDNKDDATLMMYLAGSTRDSLYYVRVIDDFIAKNSTAATHDAVVNQMISATYKDAVVVKTIATGEEYAIAISKDNEALLEAVDKALNELIEDGTVASIVDKYIGG